MDRPVFSMKEKEEDEGNERIHEWKFSGKDIEDICLRAQHERYEKERKNGADSEELYRIEGDPEDSREERCGIERGKDENDDQEYCRDTDSEESKIIGEWKSEKNGYEENEKENIRSENPCDKTVVHSVFLLCGFSISERASFLVRIEICCSRRSMAERSLKIIRKTRMNPARTAALTLSWMPMISAVRLVRFGKMTMAVIPPQTTTRTKNLMKV